MPLLSTTRKATALAPPLPVRNSEFARNGVSLRAGQFSLWAAAPGVGKSLIATNLAVRTPIPALVFTADSDEWTVRTRVCSILTGQKLYDIEKQLDQEAWANYYADALRNADHVDWCFRTDLDLEFIAHRLLAYAEMRGDYPALMIVDNLGNAVGDLNNEGPELREICRELQAMARTSRMHVMGLHHVKGAKEDGTKEIGQGDLLWNLAKIPEQVFGLSRGPEGVLTVTVPKNRGGKSGIRMQLPIDYATATIGGFQ